MGQSPRRSAARDAIWWILAALVLLIAGIGLGIKASGVGVFSWDLAVGRAVQRPGWSGFDTVAWAASRAGDSWPALLLVSLVAAGMVSWRKRLDLAIFILAASALRAVGPWLKALFSSSRPSPDVIAILERVNGFGYPSGHAFGAALVYGAIAIAVPRVISHVSLSRLVRVAALVMVFLIAWSRVRLGVHWTSDVVGGLAFGFGFIFLLYAAVTTFRQGALKK